MKEKLTIEEARKAFRSATGKVRNPKTAEPKMRERKRRKPPQWKIISCAICGQPISVLTIRTKYCADCKKEVVREKNRKTAEQRKTVPFKGMETRQAERKTRKPQVDANASAARAAGMSYGRYVAMKGAGKI